VKERLQKFMARSGVASRRACEEIIAQGRVRVNGAVVTEPGRLVDPGDDSVEVDGRPVGPASLVYYMLNKPPGYLSSARDDRMRRTVLDLVPDDPRVYPVGRLDKDTAGLILLTNDGDLAHALTHPKFEVAKTYVARVRGMVDRHILALLLEGVALDDGPARADRASALESGRESLVRIEIHEGRKRIVRRMLEAVGTPVVELQRESIGPLSLAGLAEGKFRRLEAREVSMLYTCAGTSVRRAPGRRGLEPS
jgi:pseudouridine synthase